MPRYDNSSSRFPHKRVARARKKVSELVKKGYRLNPNKASDAYHNAIIKYGNRKEKQVSSARLAAGNRASKKNRNW